MGGMHGVSRAGADGAIREGGGGRAPRRNVEAFGGVLQPVRGLMSDEWRLGVIVNHTARPLTLEEIKEVIGRLSRAEAQLEDRLVGPTGAATQDEGAPEGVTDDAEIVASATRAAAARGVHIGTFKLAGGIHARLTSAEATEWDLFIGGTPEHARWVEAEAAKCAALARQHATPDDRTDEIVACKINEDARRRVVYRLAHRWCEALRERGGGDARECLHHWEISRAAEGEAASAPSQRPPRSDSGGAS